MPVQFDLSAYLTRIGYDGPIRPDLITLDGLHRAHLMAVSYENFDVQLGHPVTTDPLLAFEKIVGRGRGGWCYEMNGLFGLALETLGFRVTRLAGSVLREIFGAANDASHLVLKVDLDETIWIADVGYGDGPVAPFRLAAGGFEQRGFEFHCEMLGEGWWRLRNHRFAPRSFDVQLTPANETTLAAKCAQLQCAPTSVFVQNAIAQRHTQDGLIVLRNRAFRRIGADGVSEVFVEDVDEYAWLLRSEFGLDLSEVADLWPRVYAQHEAAAAKPH